MPTDPALIFLLAAQGMLTGAIAMTKGRNVLAWAVFATLLPLVAFCMVLALPATALSARTPGFA